MSYKKVFRQAVSFIMTVLMLLSYVPLNAEAAATMSMKVKVEGTRYYDGEDCGEYDLGEDSYATIKLTYKNIGYATIQIHEASGATMGVRTQAGVINQTSKSTSNTVTVKVPFTANEEDSGYTVGKELPVGDYAFWIWYKNKQSDSTAEKIVIYFSLVKNTSGNIIVSKSSISLNWGASNEDSFTVSGVSSYDVSVDSTNSVWLGCEKSGKTVRVYTKSANYSSFSRSATVTVTSGSSSKTVKVTQKKCGEAAPTIVAKTGSSLSSLTTISSGSSIGTFSTSGEDVFYLYAQVNHVRRIVVNIKSTSGTSYLQKVFDSSTGVNGSSQTVECFVPVQTNKGKPLSAGKYYFEIWASNSPIKDDPWSQHPSRIVVYFDVAGDGGKDFSDISSAKDYPNIPTISKNAKETSTDWSKKNTIVYVQQQYGVADLYDSSIWGPDGGKAKCTRASTSSAFSYLNIKALPKYIGDTIGATEDQTECGCAEQPYPEFKCYLKPYGNYANDNKCTVVNLRYCKNELTLDNFVDMYNDYANDTDYKYSPLVIYTNYLNGIIKMHSLLIVGHSSDNNDVFYVLNPGNNGGNLQRIKLKVVDGQIRIEKFSNSSSGNNWSTNSYNENYTTCHVWQYIRNGSATTATITYNANGGSNAPASQTATRNTTVKLSTQVPTRSGYVFKGWATSSASTTAQYQPGASYTLTANVTLYAVWEKEQAAQYTISGTITSATQTNNTVTVILYDEVGKNFSKVTTANGSYTFTAVKAGSYMIRVSKDHHADRDYDITVKNANVIQNVKICLLGDVNMDGKIKSTDYLWVKQYISKKRSFDDYQKELADVNKKNGVTSVDVLWIKQRVLGIRDEDYKLVK